MSYEVKLDVFEGPFQLLLSLIAEHRVDVCDVPIAKLTEDYIAHVEQLGHADLEVTTEFLVVAATLLALKARALMPTAPTDLDEEDERERDLLIARLLEVRTFQEAGALLSGLLAENDLRYAALPASDDDALRLLPSLEGISAGDLARSLVDVVVDALRQVDTSKVVVDQVSTQEAAEALVRSLERGPTRFESVARGRGVTWAVALFLAMLELAMRGDIVLSEGQTVGDIELRLRPAS